MKMLLLKLNGFIKKKKKYNINKTKFKYFENLLKIFNLCDYIILRHIQKIIKQDYQIDYYNLLIFISLPMRG